MRGHNLCWHTENPSWLTNGGFNASELRTILQEHIHAVVTHYGARALAWDVVNEALDSNGLKSSPPWYPAVPDYIDIAFRAARKAGGPGVKLFYNDYSAEGMNSKSDQVYKLVSGMQARGVPIDGVGLQFLELGRPPAAERGGAEHAAAGRAGARGAHHGARHQVRAGGLGRAVHGGAAQLAGGALRPDPRDVPRRAQLQVRRDVGLHRQAHVDRHRHGAASSTRTTGRSPRSTP